MNELLFANEQRISVKGIINQNRILKNMMKNKTLEYEIEAVEILDLLKEKFFIKLTKGLVKSYEDITKYAQKYNICTKCWNYITVIIELDDCRNYPSTFCEKDIDLFNYIIKKTAEEICRKFGQGYAFSIQDEEVVVIIGINSNDYMTIKQVIEIIKCTVNKILNISTTICVSSFYKNLSYLHSSYISLKEISNLKFFIGKNRIIYSNEINNSNYIKLTCQESIENQVLSLLQNRDMEGIIDFITCLFYSFNNKEIIYNHFYSIISIINGLLHKNSKKLSDLVDENVFMYYRVVNKETLDDIVSDIKTICVTVIKYLDSVDYKNPNKIVEEIKNYINEHFAESISLEIIAEKVRLHPIYLSKIFKTETGMNFVDYLTTVRINKSKELLKKLTTKTYEISEQVGYYSSRYFSKVFKKVVGVTPKEYRKSILDNT